MWTTNNCLEMGPDINDFKIVIMTHNKLSLDL